jgi:predicted unusual protein kinase regulating ubiquinone biosynthesis (AarF/ABC1/UbiB family)
MAGSTADDDALDEVVVKVAHPDVASQIAQDFRLLSWLSAAAARLPALRGLSLRESVSQFSHTMTAQTDLRVEAIHALRFHNNFQGVRSSVVIPRPLPGLVSPTVLVETYEAGRSVATYMKEATAINTHIVGLGVDAFLKMLLVDNFVHTDLHPGNILFRAVPTNSKGHKQRKRDKQRVQMQPKVAQLSQQQRQQRDAHWWQVWHRPGSRSGHSSGTISAGSHYSTAASSAVDSTQATVEESGARKQHVGEQAGQAWGSALHDTDTTQSTASRSSSAELMAQLLQQQATGQSTADGGASAQLVLLDFGLAEELTPEVRHHFISFLMAISAGDGLAAARHLLSWSHSQTCPDRSAFTADVIHLFRQECDIHSAAGIDLDAVMKAVLGLARKHHVSIDSCYASLVISVCVLVGFAKALDPGVNLMDAATPTLLAYAMTGAVVGRLYST